MGCVRRRNQLGWILRYYWGGGRKLSDEELAAIRITPVRFRGEWNYITRVQTESTCHLVTSSQLIPPASKTDLVRQVCIFIPECEVASSASESAYHGDFAGWGATGLSPRLVSSKKWLPVDDQTRVELRFGLNSGELPRREPGHEVRDGIRSGTVAARRGPGPLEWTLCRA